MKKVIASSTLILGMLLTPILLVATPVLGQAYGEGGYSSGSYNNSGTTTPNTDPGQPIDPITTPRDSPDAQDTAADTPVSSQPSNTPPDRAPNKPSQGGDETAISNDTPKAGTDADSSTRPLLQRVNYGIASVSVLLILLAVLLIKKKRMNP